MIPALTCLLFALTINSVSSTSINSANDILTIEASASGLSNTQYLQAAFTKEGEASNYFGFTKNLAGDWYKYKPSPTSDDLTKYFYSFVPNSGTWSGQLQVKVDLDDSGYKGSGNYLLKLFKPTSSSKSENSIKIAVSISKPVTLIDQPQSQPKAEEKEPEKLPEVLPPPFVPQPKVENIKIVPKKEASKSAEVLSIATASGSQQEIPIIEESKPKKSNSLTPWILGVTGFGLLVGVATVFVKKRFGV